MNDDLSPRHDLAALRTILGVPDTAALEPIMSGSRALKRHEQVYADGDATDVHVLVAGTLKASRSSIEGTGGIIRFYYAGEILWSYGFHLNRRSMTVTAVEDSRLYTFPHSRLQSLMFAYPNVQRRCYATLSRLIKEEQEFAAVSAAGSADRRMAFFLLRALERQNPVDQIVRLPMKRLDIANHLGLSTDAVARSFTRLRRARIVAIERCGIAVIDRANLERAASAGHRTRGDLKK